MWSVIGIISGAIAFVFVPILFGLLGILLGLVGRRKGDETLGLVAIVVSIIAIVTGPIFWAIMGYVNAVQ